MVTPLEQPLPPPTQLNIASFDGFDYHGSEFGTFQHISLLKKNSKLILKAEQEATLNIKKKLQIKP